MSVLIIEGAILLGIFLAALTASYGLARRLASGRGALRAGLVLLLSALVWQIAAAAGWKAFGQPQQAPHLRAWFVFWSVVLGLNLAELLLLRIYSWLQRPCPVPQLLRNLFRASLYVLTAFLILRFQLGLNISPLLASTALVTAVVGFALQGVLANLLAGMSLHLVGSVMPGDWIAIGDAEGEVVETNWRETRLRTRAGHLLIVPNSHVAGSIINNMTRPTPRRRHTINVGASYSDAPGDVIEALIAAARSVPEVLADPPPSAYVTEFKDFGINYQLRFWSDRYYNRLPIEGDVMRMIWYQFKRRGIEIPFPMSDKLLNDFMAVVYRQRRMPPEKQEVADLARDLMQSDFIQKWLVDETGRPLLTEEDILKIAPSLRRQRFTAGETIFQQGEAGETCYVLVRGRVRGRVEFEEGLPAHEFELNEGDLFGEMSLLTGLPRTATIMAPAECEVLCIPQEVFRRLLALRPEIPEILARRVAARAESNRSAYQRLRAVDARAVEECLKHENILARFLKLLGLRG